METNLINETKRKNTYLNDYYYYETETPCES